MADKTDDLRKRAKTRKDFTEADKKNVEQVRKVYGETASDKLGTFQESWGGGKPLKAGEKAPSKEWVEKNRVMQPRDEDGKFTYNAVNLKDLKDGPSRGTTPMPIIRVKDKLFREVFAESEDIVVNANKRIYAKVTSNYKTFEKTLRQYSEGSGFGLDVKGKKGRWSQKEKVASGLSKKIGRPVFIKEISFEQTFAENDKETESKPKTETPTPEKTKTPTQEKTVNTQASTPSSESVEKTAENNKELIGEMMKTIPGLNAFEAATVIASGKVKNIDDLKRMLGV
jgi:hypothetical protein